MRLELRPVFSPCEAFVLVRLYRQGYQWYCRNKHGCDVGNVRAPGCKAKWGLHLSLETKKTSDSSTAVEFRTGLINFLSRRAFSLS
jgi:hypothetical protein